MRSLERSEGRSVCTVLQTMSTSTSEYACTTLVRRPMACRHGNSGCAARIAGQTGEGLPPHGQLVEHSRQARFVCLQRGLGVPSHKAHCRIDGAHRVIQVCSVVSLRHTRPPSGPEHARGCGHATRAWIRGRPGRRGSRSTHPAPHPPLVPCGPTQAAPHRCAGPADAHRRLRPPARRNALTGRTARRRWESRLVQRSFGGIPWICGARPVPAAPPGANREG